MNSAEGNAGNRSPDPDGIKQRWQRLGRLTLKELREILRDRRTIITLILMPILVYPMLSIVFGRFLVTQVGDTLQPKYVIGFTSEGDAKFLEQLIIRFNDPDREFLETEIENQTVVPKLTYVQVDDLKAEVRNFQIDLGVELTLPDDPALQADRDLAVDCELIFDRSSVNGRMAAEFVQQLIEDANREFLIQRLKFLGIEQRAVPVQTTMVEVESEEVFGPVSLFSVIPLILILMTITGAVYPAIDLTAGERERGTLEVLIAAPIPRMGLLLAKYFAVLTVAMLTASVNLLMMTITISVDDVAQEFLGSMITPQIMLQVFCLLVLFAMFFSAVLLTLTSFARSFKEAQAYLIPLMLLSLAPGVLSLMPGLKLSGPLAIVPLLNIVLLGRDLMESQVELGPMVAVVVSTFIYALAAITVAGKIFGAEGVLYSSEGSWSDFMRRPEQAQARPSLTNALFCLACLFPAYFLVSNLTAQAEELPTTARMVLSAGATALLFGALPLIAAYWGRVRIVSGFSLGRPPAVNIIGAALIGLGLWVFAYEAILLTSDIDMGDRFQEIASKVIEQLRSVHPAVMLLAYAVFPATFEEFSFRGYLYNAIRPRTSAWQTILATAVIFGLFHFVIQGVLAPARLANSTVLGIVLGWIRYRSGSIWPGVVMHTCHNGFLLLLEHYKAELAARFSFFAILESPQDELTSLPFSWLAAASATVAIGIVLIVLTPRKQEEIELGNGDGNGL